MYKTIATILIVLGLALIVAGFSVQVFPQWLSLPGGVLLILSGAFLSVSELGGKLKDWRDFLFGVEKKEAKPKSSNQKEIPSLNAAPIPTRQRSQNMIRSDDGEQMMHGQSGIQKQEMQDSSRGKQRMD